MRTDKILILPFILLLTGVLCSCSLSSLKPKPADPIKFYTLDYESPSFEKKPILPVALALENFTTTPPYNTNRIIYRTGRYSQNKYYYYRWITAPEDIITPLLARDMIASNRFQAVMVACDFFTKYQLTGTINEFNEQDTDSGWNAVISITVTLINKEVPDEKTRIEFQKTYKQIQSMDRKNPESLARAMSTAMAEISRQMIADVYLALQEAPT